MRFPPESTDDANKGLSIVQATGCVFFLLSLSLFVYAFLQDLLKPVKQQFPELSIADIWTFASCAAVKLAGGPSVEHRFGRSDDPDGRRCPLNGRLPDASKGADHVREVFGRMGFNDRETVALCGAHTLGRCHVVRSGYDGPWTRNPLKFDNQYFKNLMGLEWKVKKWDGPLQYVDVLTEELMMLPTDMALRTDDKFRVWAELYARDEQAFFDDFAAAYARLISLGCPSRCDPSVRAARVELSPAQQASLSFREHAMHGSVLEMRKYRAAGADVQEREAQSNRTALHKVCLFHAFFFSLLKKDFSGCFLGTRRCNSLSCSRLQDCARCAGF
jgi:hypothetical protein